MPRRRIGSRLASTQRSFLLASRRSPPRSTYTQVRSRTAVTRTVAPSRVASKASISNSSSSRGISLSHLVPLGLGFADTKGPVDCARILAAGGDDLRAQSALTGGAGRGVAAALDEAPGERFAARGWREALRPALDGVPERPLEELTPHFPYPAYRVRDAPKRRDRRARRRIDHHLVLSLGHAFRMHPDHAVMNATFLDHQRADFGIALQAAGAGDLEAAGGHDVAAHETRDRHPVAADIGLDVRFRADPQVAVALNVAAEIAQDLAAALQLQLARQCIIAADNGRLRLDAVGVGTPVAPRNRHRLHPNVRHLDLPYPAPQLVLTQHRGY